MSVQLTADEARPVPHDSYLFGPGAAWFAYAMTLGLMVMDYVDRQVIGILAPTLTRDLHWSEGDYAAIVSWWSVAYGIGLLFTSGFWYFGIIISVVSVLFPLTKIAALTWFLASIWQRSTARSATCASSS